MPRRTPRLTRTHATALLLPAPAGEPDRTVLVLTDDATLGYATPEAVLTGRTGRVACTRMPSLTPDPRWEQADEQRERSLPARVQEALPS
ncbi:hypothetical protein [Nonomuraea sp. NPDC005692]|uniref:hypothetical protein n=1 Tax=Nonomuraea sp. NPDC005692 TaxID=3157168 RepID=UPI0033DF5929